MKGDYSRRDFLKKSTSTLLAVPFISLENILMNSPAQKNSKNKLIDPKNNRALDYYFKNSNYVFRGTIRKQSIGWSPEEDAIYNIYHFGIGNDEIDIVYPETSLIEWSGRGIFTPPTLQLGRDYIVFTKKMQLDEGESVRYIGTFIINHDEKVVLYNGENKEVLDFVEILKKRSFQNINILK
jgi:hypothetical protein